MDKCLRLEWCLRQLTALMRHCQQWHEQIQPLADQLDSARQVHTAV